jgi:acetyl/propionyl-CoA carboxylase alpha subunit
LNNFLPDIGTLSGYQIPKGPGVRVDDGFEEGMQIPIHYDPMIAKLVVHGKNREEAMDRMLRAIDEYRITGVATTLSFCSFVLRHDAFRSGQFDTHFVKSHFRPEFLTSYNEHDAMVASIVATELIRGSNQGSTPIQKTGSTSNWKRNRSV